MKKYVLLLLFTKDFSKILLIKRKKKPFANLYNGIGGKIEEKKYDDEFEAKQHYFSINKPNKLRQLNLIKECKYYTIYWEWL